MLCRRISLGYYGVCRLVIDSSYLAYMQCLPVKCPALVLLIDRVICVNKPIALSDRSRTRYLHLK